jgi:hypothetical protein
MIDVSLSHNSIIPHNSPYFRIVITANVSLDKKPNVWDNLLEKAIAFSSQR